MLIVGYLFDSFSNSYFTELFFVLVHYFMINEIVFGMLKFLILFTVAFLAK